MMLMLVGESSGNFDCWNCLDAEGKTHIVDLCVDNDKVRPLLKQGKYIYVDYLYPHVEIAMNVRESP